MFRACQRLFEQHKFLFCGVFLRGVCFLWTMARWVLLLLTTLCAAALADDDSDVIELDADTFDDGIDEPIILVEFYAPW